jgi:magnesium chelatase family protein
MVGTPGAGKTILTKRLTTISPPLTLEEVLEIAKVRLAAVKINEHTALMTKRPFRSRHRTISYVAIS